MAQTVRNPLALQGTWVQSLDQIVFPFSLWRLSTLVFLPGEFHGQRSLVSYSPWDPKESDMAEQLTLFFFFKLYKIVLVLPNINMNLPQVCMLTGTFFKTDLLKHIVF